MASAARLLIGPAPAAAPMNPRGPDGCSGSARVFILTAAYGPAPITRSRSAPRDALSVAATPVARRQREELRLAKHRVP